TLQEQPLLLADGSAEGDVMLDLVDDTAADVKGKIVLTDRQPGVAWPGLVGRGASALISAYRPEYFGRRPPLDAVAWEQAPPRSMAITMMISPRRAEELRDLIHRGMVTVKMHARVRRTSPGEIGQVMGEIPGEIPDRDIVLVAHLDHQKPGANDNASGSGTLLELVRVARKMGRP